MSFPVFVLALSLALPAQVELQAELQALLRDARYAQVDARASAALAGAAPDILDEARWAHLAAVARRRSGRQREPETLALALRAVEIRAARLGAHVDTAHSLHELGILSIQRGELDEARARLVEALGMRAAVLGDDHLAVAQTHAILGALSTEEGDIEGALAHFEAARTIQDAALDRDEAVDPLDIAQRLAFEGNVLRRLGRTAEARTAWERTLVLVRAELRHDHPEVSTAEHNLGLLLGELEDYDRATELLERALASRERLDPPRPVLVGATLKIFAGIASRGGELDRARELFERAIELAARTYGEDRSEAVHLELLYANALCDKWQELPRARELFSAALASGFYEARARDGLGRVALREERWEEAVSQLAEARRLFAAQGEWRHELWAQKNLALARLGDDGDSAAAVRTWEKILAKEEAVLGADAYGIVWTLRWYAFALVQQDEHDRALEQALRAHEIALHHWDELWWTSSERVALHYQGLQADGLDFALYVAAHRDLEADAAERIFDTLVRSRGLVLDTLAARRRLARASRDPEIAALLVTSRQAADTLSDLVVGGAGEAELATARAEKWRGERALALAADVLRPSDRTPVTAADVLQALADDALVAYATYEPEGFGEARYVAFVRAHADAALRVVPLGQAAPIEAAVQRWSRAVRRPGADYRAVGEALRQLVWDPVEEVLDAAGAARERRQRTLHIVPDGVLHLVSFDALPLGEADYLIDRFDLGYLATERDLVRREPVSACAPGLLAFGGPTFDRKRARGARNEPTAEGRFGPLPQAEREAAAVVAAWRASGRERAALYTGHEATETVFKQLAPECTVLHVATHAYFAGTSASASGARGVSVAAVAAADGPPLPDAPGRDALLSSGLAFAGANDSGTREASITRRPAAVPRPRVSSSR